MSILTNIIDGMDQARFRSSNTNKEKEENKGKTKDKIMPMVLKKLKNGS